MTEFRKGSDLLFFDAVGVPYGRLYVKGDDPYLVISLKQGRDLLKNGVDNKVFTADVAELCDEAMVQAGLLPDDQAIFQKIASFQLPEGFTSRFNFRMCECDNPMPHGYLYDEAGKKIGFNKPISTLIDGVQVCGGGVQGGHIDLPTAVHLFNQMQCTTLALNDEEWEKAFESLPEDVRRKMEEEARRNADPVARLMAALGIDV